MMAPSPTDQKIAALQQRYAQSQQLIDLLALQKLKQQQDAAKREMQMKAAQEMSGMGAPTVKDQLENEMVGRSKQEVVEQLNAMAAEKQKRQQEALQRMTESGIAQNPVPAMNLSGGGIVAFARGGTAETDEQKLERLIKELARLKSAGPVKPSVSARGGAREPSALQEGLAAIGQKLKGVFTPKDEQIARLEQEIASLQQRKQAAPQPAAPVAPAPQPPAPPVAAPQPPAPRGPAPAPQPPAPPVAAPQSAEPQAPAAAGLEDILRKKLEGMTGEDYKAAGAEEEKYLEQRRQLTPEQQAVYDQGIAAAKRRMEDLADPERARQERITRGLLATAGGGNFAAYGAGSLNAAEQQRLARKQAEEDYAKAAEGLVGIQRAIVDKALEGRGAERKLVNERELKGIGGLGDIYQIQQQAKTAGLDRDSRERIAIAQARAQEAATAATREGNAEIRATRLQQALTQALNEATDLVDRRVVELEKQRDLTGKLTPDQQKTLEALLKERDITRKAVMAEFTRQSVGKGDGFGAVREVKK